MGATELKTVERALVRELTDREERRLEDATPKSRAMFEEARKCMPLGVPSSFQTRDPYPVYFSHGKGSKIYSVDGQEISDFHNGFGCMVAGHAHPVIVETVQKRMELGSQFSLPTEDSIIVAQRLTERFKLPKWRFVNSGSEATMDAIRIARAATGNDYIVKIFGSYHGHHDYAMVCIGWVDWTERGPRDDYASIPYGGGVLQAAAEYTIPVPFNDAPVMERRIERLIDEGKKPACVIIEPAMMNLGVILPEPGYLEAVRAITRKHGIVLIFDEVKTGITTAAGGAVERFGVVPDMVCLAKALAGGLPVAAIGGTDEVMEPVENGSVYQVGTYSGNPLCMAAARANLERVMTPEAYDRLDYLEHRLTSQMDAIAKKYDFPAYTVGIRAKGVVHWASGPITDYDSYMKYQDGEMSDLAWLYNLNRGVIIAPGRDQEWTFSIQHTDEDIDRYVAAYESLIRELVS